jgi:hypothetical protein
MIAAGEKERERGVVAEESKTKVLAEGTLAKQTNSTSRHRGKQTCYYMYIYTAFPLALPGQRKGFNQVSLILKL